MRNNKIGDNPALAAILKTVKTNEKEYKTTKLTPKKKTKDNKALHKVIFEKNSELMNTRDRETELRLENTKLTHKIDNLTIILTQAICDLNHLIEAREIEKSIIKEMKEGIYSRWKQL